MDCLASQKLEEHQNLKHTLLVAPFQCEAGKVIFRRLKKGPQKTQLELTGEDLELVYP